MNKLEEMLNNEIKLNKKETWSKLDKTMKISKFNIFANEYCKNNNLNDDEVNKLQLFLKNKLNQRRLMTNKEVNYDIDKQIILLIPNLIYNDNQFILKRNDKRRSTVKSLTPSKHKI